MPSAHKTWQHTDNIMAYISFQQSDYYSNLIYTGDGSASKALTGTGFQPDVTWIKNRDSTNWNILTDSSRGRTDYVYPNAVNIEDTGATTMVLSWESNGFTIGDSGNVNTDTEDYASWNWKVNGGTTASNGIGSITSTVQVDATRGISIAEYTGNGVSGASFGHSLGIVPECILIKCLNTAHDWAVYHKGVDNSPEDKFLVLNENNAVADNVNKWNDTLPTTTSITLGNGGGVNADTQTHVAYFFSSVKGYSKFGNYTGTGNNNGTFVHLGFRPAFLLIKNTGATKNWYMFDSARDPYNLTDRALKPDTAGAEVDSSDYNSLDLLSNGFKLRGGSSGVGDDLNGAYNYVYMAFAKYPVVSSNSIPATAV